MGQGLSTWFMIPQQPSFGVASPDSNLFRHGRSCFFGHPVKVLIAGNLSAFVAR
jgi:hypothetical protein